MTSARFASSLVVSRGVCVTAFGVLPVFLVGAMSVQMRADLNITPGQFGLAATLFFMTAAVTARSAGSAVQRHGSATGTAIATATSATALFVIAATPNVGVLLVGAALGGMGNAAAQPSANLDISRRIGHSRLGLAFGIKQASVPLATMMSGLAVPAVALPHGWRWTFVIFGGAALMMALGSLLRRPSAGIGYALRTTAAMAGDSRRRLYLLSLAGGLGVTASTSLGVFLVDAGVRVGLPVGTAGLLVAVVSALGLGVRVLVGWLLDRFPQRNAERLIAHFIIAGSAGYGLLALGVIPAHVAGAVLAYCAGWSWTGALHCLVVRQNLAAAAAATGILQTGLSTGAALGPLAFGILAQQGSYSTAWIVAGVTSALTAALFWWSGREEPARSPEAQTGPR